MKVEHVLLKRQIREFTNAAHKNLDSYNVSELMTLKCHALSHLVDALRQDGSLKYLNAGVFKSSHKFFKNDYSKFLKELGSAMKNRV